MGLMTVNVGSMHRMLGDLDEAYSSVAKGLSILVAMLGENHHLTGVAYNALAGIQQEQNDDAVAEANYRKALAIFESTAGANHPHTVAILNGLASVLIKSGQAREAETYYRRAVGTGFAVLPHDHPNLAIVQLGLAHVAAGQGRCSQAIELRDQYLPFLEAAGQGDRSDVTLAVQAINACH